MIWVWFRRDLRAADNTALYHALTRCRRVLCAFVFDRDILAPLDQRDRRVPFIHASVVELDRILRDAGGTPIVRDGHPVHDIPALARECGMNAVFANPSAKERDDTVAKKFVSQDIAFFTFKNQAVFDHDEVMTGASKPYVHGLHAVQAQMARNADARCAQAVRIRKPSERARQATFWRQACETVNC